MKITGRRKMWVLIALITTIAFMTLEAVIDYKNHINSVDETSTLLLTEAINVISDNANKEAVLIESLKDDYITRARAISYTIEHDSSLEENVSELKKLASLMNVDEVHLFDSDGTIYGGTVKDYYGVSMESGEQIGYFKPMLTDYKLAMCQDILPNTAEGKFMMYAMVWREDHKGLVQVGIEPQRLFSEMHSYQMVEVVDSMPMIEGYSLYVADDADGVIYGATEHESIGSKLSDIGIEKVDGRMGNSITVRVKGKNSRVLFEPSGDYVIGVKYDYDNLFSDIIFNLLTVLICVITFMLLIYWIVSIYDKRNNLFIEEIDRSNEDRDRQYAILKSMSEMYTSMYLLDIKNNTVSEYVSTDRIREHFIETDDVAELMKAVMSGRASIESREAILEFCDLHTIADRMKNVKSIYKDFINKEGRWARATFISIYEDEEGRPSTLIYAVLDVDEEKKREEILLLNSNTDELTRCFNRRAYEDDIRGYEKRGIPEDLILVSMDINGLKMTNDNLGHAAGDELILGAVSCMRNVLGAYGHVYRTGGDEFMAILTVEPAKMKDIVQDFEDATSRWHGRLVKELAVSLGYVIYGEDKPAEFSEMEKLADKRMYETKSKYYVNLGVDRRGQATAYNALCNSYEKILKVNMAEDSYHILKVNEDETTNQKGFDEKISEWLRNFGESGQVHPEDLEEYLKNTDIDFLREYFRKGNSAHTITYRRMVGGNYRHVMMEMVRAESYSQDREEVYLYVKILEV